MKVGIISFTARGALVCRRLCGQFREEGVDCVGYAPLRFMRPEWENEGMLPQTLSLGQWTGAMFEEKRGIVFVGAAGIAVRAIAPFVRDKMTDPAVVAVDEAGHYCIPLLSGHMGGANELASRIAQWLHGTAVITTATDVNGVFAVDVFASAHGLAITDREEARRISAQLLEGREIGFFSDTDIVPRNRWQVPKGCVEQVRLHNIWITFRSSGMPEGKETASGCGPLETGLLETGPMIPGQGAAGRQKDESQKKVSGPVYLRLVPKMIVLGLGCRKGADPAVLERHVLEALKESRIDLAAVKAAATIDIKREEAAVTDLAKKYGWELRTYTSAELSLVKGNFQDSDFVRKTVGVGNVCERACVAQGGRLLLHKQGSEGVTVAASYEAPDDVWGA